MMEFFWIIAVAFLFIIAFLLGNISDEVQNIKVALLNIQKNQSEEYYEILKIVKSSLDAEAAVYKTIKEWSEKNGTL